MRFGRSCKDCRTYQYDESSGRPVPDRTAARKGLPMLRPKGGEPECHTCGKTAHLPFRERTWRAVTDPPPWAYRCFAHWRAGAATGWADGSARDPIVRANADLFGAMRDAARDAPARQTAAALSAIAAAVRLLR